jgi:hypothetical protein
MDYVERLGGYQGLVITSAADDIIASGTRVVCLEADPIRNVTERVDRSFCRFIELLRGCAGRGVVTDTGILSNRRSLLRRCRAQGLQPSFFTQRRSAR